MQEALIADWASLTPDKHAPGTIPEAQSPFKIWMISEVLKPIRIAFRCVVLHHCDVGT
jgi:hypothetical protein